ncbi:AzlC family ABC transporter permease [Actinomyces sp. 2119]|uniref:AzlC family ABC transporter permease n=1 Tax=Actinomyces sp. 2119 TaxID=2321393 RepID=UPI0026D550D6
MTDLPARDDPASSVAPGPETPGQPPTSTRAAARDAVPVVVGYVTLGLAAGVLLVAQGLSWWWAPLWSLLIYSGTMQMLLVPLAGAGEPLATIAVSTVFVSGRHVFYGLGFPLERVRGRLAARLYSVHAITDEVYALLASKDHRLMSGRYVLTVQALSHAAWTAGTTAGALAGTGLAAVVGERIGLLGFVLTALFVVLAIENWRTHPDVAVLCLGMLAGGTGLLVGGSAALLVALTVLAAGLVALFAWRRRGPRPGRKNGRGQPGPRGGRHADSCGDSHGNSRGDSQGDSRDDPARSQRDTRQEGAQC